jgi:SAM-dependent methyltransferase
MGELGMPGAAVPAMYAPATFEKWQATRVATEPFFRKVYEQAELHLGGAETILDVAGGDGHTLDVLSADLQTGLVTVDVDGRALDRLQEQYPGANAVEADVRQLPFDDESFDAAISISGLDSFGNTSEAVTEIERVLKPAGKFVFFRDVPYALRGFVTALMQDMPDEVRKQAIAAPIINQTTGAIDRFAFLPKPLIALLRLQTGNIAGKMALDAVSPYIGEDWFDRIYTGGLETGSIAKRFTRLHAELEILLSEQGEIMQGMVIPVAEPVAPILERVQFRRFQHSGMHVTKELVEIDYQSEELLYVAEKPVKELYVDELANLQTRAISATNISPESSTHVHGRLPLYIARKN